jgi:hypothetical protein
MDIFRGCFVQWMGILGGCFQKMTKIQEIFLLREERSRGN